MTVTGSPSLARIDSSGPIHLSPAGGIVGLDTWLILAMSNGSRTTGNIDVASLDVVFTGVAGGTSLTGIVGGLGGDEAAGAADLSPVANSVFQINGCPIGSVNCVLITTASIPAAPPLRDIFIGTISNPTDEEDLLLPLVSDQEY
jgi:hypothetical protein